MKKLCLMLLASVLIISCKKDEKPEEIIREYLNGTFIINEGSFGNNNSSITHIDHSGIVSNDIYLTVNDHELGDVLQSFAVAGERGYAVLNNSAKIEVINLRTMKTAGTITGADYPRYILPLGDGRAYLTNGSWEGDVKIVDLSTNAILSSIPVGFGPEKMVKSGSFVYVCNYAFGGDNRVSVIDVTTNQVVNNITVADGPVDIVSDAQGIIWVLCAGNIVYDENWNIVSETHAAIARIDPSDFSVIDQHEIGGEHDHPLHLAVSPDGNTVYYENNGVFALNSLTMDFPGTLLINEDRHSLDINPSNGDIWCAGTTDYTNPSTVYRYTQNGELKGNFLAGVASNAVVFN